MIAETIWLSPEVAANDNQPLGGDDGAGGYAPLAVVTGSGASTALYWIHGNHLGVPIVTTDAGGAVASPTGFTMVGFPGQTRTLADLYYNRYRDYDSSMGRYIQADPIGLEGDANPYVYALNNPLKFTDPLGLESEAGLCIRDKTGKIIFCEYPIKPTYWEQWLPVGRVVKMCFTWYRYGAEFPQGGKTRIAPFGNRNPNWNKPPHPIGRWPHYHRPGEKGPDGLPLPGQGGGRHRPWESSPHDKSPWDRF